MGSVQCTSAADASGVQAEVDGMGRYGDGPPCERVGLCEVARSGAEHGELLCRRRHVVYVLVLLSGDCVFRYGNSIRS
jgi:hypothetical protein